MKITIHIEGDQHICIAATELNSVWDNLDGPQGDDVPVLDFARALHFVLSALASSNADWEYVGSAMENVSGLVHQLERVILQLQRGMGDDLGEHFENLN